MNNGLGDGVLLLKDSSGKVVSAGAINKTDDGTLLQIHQAQLDKTNNQLSEGRIEQFTPSDLDVNS